MSKERLDRLINKENLTEDDLKYMHLSQLEMFAYGIKGDTNYERIYGHLAILQHTRKCYDTKDVFYIIDNTGLSKQRKMWLKFRYLFL